MGGGGGCGASANEYSCAHKFWKSHSMFNLQMYQSVNRSFAKLLIPKHTFLKLKHNYRCNSREANSIMDKATTVWMQQQQYGCSNNSMDAATAVWMQQQHYGCSKSSKLQNTRCRGGSMAPILCIQRISEVHLST
jgi:hypothetical protein